MPKVVLLKVMVPAKEIVLDTTSGVLYPGFQKMCLVPRFVALKPLLEGIQASWLVVTSLLRKWRVLWCGLPNPPSLGPWYR